MTYPYRYASEELIKAFEEIGYVRIESQVPNVWDNWKRHYKEVHLGELQMWMLGKHGIDIFAPPHTANNKYRFFIYVQWKIFYTGDNFFDHPQDALSAELMRAVEIVKRGG